MLYEIKVGHYKEWSVKWMQKSHESLELANHLEGDLDEIHSNMPSIYDFMVQGGKLSIEKMKIYRRIRPFMCVLLKNICFRRVKYL